MSRFKTSSIKQGAGFTVFILLIASVGNGFAAEQVAVKVKILTIKRFIQMKCLAKFFNHFGGEFGIQGIHLAGLSGRQVNN